MTDRRIRLRELRPGRATDKLKAIDLCKARLRKCSVPAFTMESLLLSRFLRRQFMSFRKYKSQLILKMRDDVLVKKIY